MKKTLLWCLLFWPVVLSAQPVLQQPFKRFATQGNFTEVRKNDLEGLINQRNQVVVPCQYVDILFSQTTALVLAAKRVNGRVLFGAFDTLGHEVVPFSYEYVRDFEPGRVIGENRFRQDAVFDATGKLLFEVPFKSMTSTGDGRYIVTQDTLGREFSAVVDRQLRTVFPLRYNHFAWVWGNWAFAVDYVHQERGLLRLSDGQFQRLDGDPVLHEPDAWGHILAVKGLDVVKEIPGTVALLDTNLREVYPYGYGTIRHLPGGEFYVLSKNHKYALGDRHGHELCDFRFDQPQVFKRQYPYVGPNAYSGGEWPKHPVVALRNLETGRKALFHHQKGWVLGDSCLEVRVVSDSTFLVQTSWEGYRLVNLKGQVISPLYPQVLTTFGATFWAKTGSTVLWCDHNGMVLQDLKCEDFPQYNYSTTRNYYLLKRKDFRALCNEQYQPLTAFKYQSIDFGYFPEGWREQHLKEPGYAEWVAVGNLPDGSKEAIDEHGKTFKIK